MSSDRLPRRVRRRSPVWARPPTALAGERHTRPHGLGDRVHPRGSSPLQPPQQVGRRAEPARATTRRESLAGSDIDRSPWRYSRWDGIPRRLQPRPRRGRSQARCRTCMMEGLSTSAEAMEWMRQHGFDLAGMNMRVMGRRGADPASCVSQLQDLLYDQYRTSTTPWTSLQQAPGRDPRSRGAGPARAARLRVESAMNGLPPEVATRTRAAGFDLRGDRVASAITAFEDEQRGRGLPGAPRRARPV